MSNVLDLVDQAFFRLDRAAGVAQVVWVYDRPVDTEGLRRFHQHLQRGRLSRHIERSPLPFGRHRWVTPAGQPALEIATAPRPREEFDAWLAEQADVALDAEHGPGWRLSVLSFVDGGTGLSLVLSHCVTDGIGGSLAILEAAYGYDHTFNWPAAGSRRRWRALREDARQTARDIPSIGRAALAAARFARRARRSRAVEPTLTASIAPIGPADEIATLPTATVFIDADEWDARAHWLGGTSNTLLAAVAARLASAAGRVGPDGLAHLAIPVNERTADDTRANAVAMLDVTVDPAPAAIDLRQIRAAVKQALIRHGAVPDEKSALLPLVPLLPRRVANRMVAVATGGARNVVVASNIGAAPPAVNRPDGTEAGHVAVRFLYPGLTKATVEQIGGLLCVHSARVGPQVFVSVLGYQPGLENTTEALHQRLSSVLSEFSMTGTTGWPYGEPVPATQESGRSATSMGANT